MGSDNSQTRNQEKLKETIIGKSSNQAYPTRKKIGLVMGPLFFILLLAFIPASDSFTLAMRSAVASTGWIAIWWLTEAVPIPATSLLPLLLFPLTGVMSFEQTATGYADSIVFLFLGGFMLAAAMQRWNLHRRIALTIVKAMGAQPARLIFGFMLATGFLSMWISNTATSMMLMPVGLAVILQVARLIKEQNLHIAVEAGKFSFGTALMLGIAYSASVGGMATLIGTPPNAIFASVAEATLDKNISFLDWMIFGFPLALVFIMVTWLYLIKYFKLGEIKGLEAGKEVIDEEIKQLGAMKHEERMVLAVFSLVALGWITRSLFFEDIFPALNDPMIAVFGALILFFLPSDISKGIFLLDWDTAVKIPWGILLLFGGGIAIAASFSESGLTGWLGNQLAVLQHTPPLLVIFGIFALVVFLSNVTSNTGTVSMILPVMIAMAGAMAVHPLGFMIVATSAASFAFILPVATPPNAVVFSSGYISIEQMARAGLGITLITITLLPLILYLWLPLVWGVGLS